MALTGRTMTLTWQQRFRPFNGLCVQPFKSTGPAPEDFCEHIVPCADRPGVGVVMGGICLRPSKNAIVCEAIELAKVYKISIEPWPDQEDQPIWQKSAPIGYVRFNEQLFNPFLADRCPFQEIFRIHNGRSQILLDDAGNWTNSSIPDLAGGGASGLTLWFGPYVMTVSVANGWAIFKGYAASALGTPRNPYRVNPYELLTTIPHANVNIFGATQATFTFAGEERTLTLEAQGGDPF